MSEERKLYRKFITESTNEARKSEVLSDEDYANFIKSYMSNDPDFETLSNMLPMINDDLKDQGIKTIKEYQLKRFYKMLQAEKPVNESRTIDDISTKEIGEFIKTLNIKSTEKRDLNPKWLADKLKENFNLDYAPNATEVDKILDNMPLDYIENSEPSKTEGTTFRGNIKFNTLGGDVQIYIDAYDSVVGFNSASRGDIDFYGPKLNANSNDYRKIENELRQKIYPFIEQAVAEYDSKVDAFMKELGFERK